MPFTNFVLCGLVMPKIEYIFIILIILLGLLLPVITSAQEFSVIKPITGYHYQERNHRGKDWNENYWDSLGLGYRHQSGFGAYAIYVNENSVNNEALFLHAEYMHNVNNWLSLGIAGGLRNGYPKKAENRSKKDFIPSAALQTELCHGKYCTLFQITDRVSVINLKYKF